MSVPWTLSLATALGIAVMTVPAVLGVHQPSSAVFHLGGALVAVFAVISMGEVLRMGRFFAGLLGLGIATLPWLLDGGTTESNLVGLCAGLTITGCSVPRGEVRERYGAWDAWIV